MDIEDQDPNQFEQMWGVLKIVASTTDGHDASQRQSKRQKADHPVAIEGEA